jgi:3-oxoadipate enol-lactonase
LDDYGGVAMAVRPTPSQVPPGRPVELPGRGTTFVREIPGPRGAPAVILVHGWTATGLLNWRPSMAALGERYRVIAIDLRGHGKGIACKPFRLVDCADDIAALIDVLEVEHAILAGYSMGGPISLLTWQRHRDVVDGVVLCATAASFPGAAQATPLFYGLLAGVTLTPIPRLGDVVRRVMTAVAPPGWIDTGEIRGHDARSLVEGGLELGRFSALGWLNEVDVPTAVVLTMRDPLVPAAEQRIMAASIPAARVFEVDGDHFACALNPQVFVPALVDACDDVAGRAAQRRRRRERSEAAEGERGRSCRIAIWDDREERSIA